MQLFLSVRRTLRFHLETSHFVLIYPVTKCIWFVFIRELKVWLLLICLFLFICLLLSGVWGGSNNISSLVKTQESKILLRCSIKIKLRCHQPWTMKRAWSLGTKRETRDFRSLGLCCQYLTASLLGHPELPRQKTKPFVLCGLNFVQSIKWFHDGVQVTFLHSLKNFSFSRLTLQDKIAWSN